MDILIRQRVAYVFLYIFVLGAIPVVADEWLPENQDQLDRIKKYLIENSDLKDPFSVEFRKVFRQSISNTICGQLNAKNSNGAYVGWTRFAIVRVGDIFSNLVIEDRDYPSSEIGSRCNGLPGAPAIPEPIAKKEECNDQNGTLYENVSIGWPIKKIKRLFVSECKSKSIKTLWNFCNNLNAKGISWKAADTGQLQDFLASKNVVYVGTLAWALHIEGFDEYTGDVKIQTSGKSECYQRCSVQKYYFTEAQPILCIEN